MFPFQRARSALYVLLFVVSTVLLGLTAKRIHDTKTYMSSYDPVVAELLAASIFGMIWSIHGVLLSSRPIETRGAIFFESIGLFALFMLYVVGAAIAVELECFVQFEKCSILKTLQGFAWICWFFTFVTLVCNAAQIVWEERYRSHTAHPHQQMSEARSEAPQMA